MPRIVRGNLVRIVTDFPKFEALLKAKNIQFVGTVLECRRKTGAYLVSPANSPFTTQPYWIDGSHLEVLG